MVKNVLIVLILLSGIILGNNTVETKNLSQKELDFNLERYSYIGDFDKVKKLIKKGANVNISPYLSNALLWAAYKDKTNIAKYLIDQGASIDSKSVSGKDILYYAVQNNNLGFVKYLLNKGMQPSQINNGHDILFKAVQRGYIDLVKLVLPLFQDINRHYILEDYDTHHKSIKTTLLITSIQNDHLDIAKLLIKNGANINKSNSKNETPILTSMRTKNFEMARFLMDNGANLKAQDIGGNNTLTYAITLKQEDIGLKAIEYVDINQWVDSSIFEGKPYIYEHYIYKNDYPRSKFVNYLHLASRYGQTKIIEKLLERKLDIEQDSKDNKYLFNALEYAVLYSDVKTVKFLVDNGANPYKHNKGSILGYNYHTLLSLCLASVNSFKNRIEIIEYLLSLPNASWYKENETNEFYSNLAKLRNLPKEKAKERVKEKTFDEKIDEAIQDKKLKKILYLTRGNDKKLLEIVKKIYNNIHLNSYEFLYMYFDDRETNIDKEIIKEFVKLNLRLKDLKKTYLLYSNNAFDFIMSDEVFQKSILDLHKNSDITDIAIAVYKDKRRSNYRIESMFELVYKYKLKFDFERFKKVLQEDDEHMNRIFNFYNKANHE